MVFFLCLNANLLKIRERKVELSEKKDLLESSVLWQDVNVEPGD